MKRSLNCPVTELQLFSAGQMGIESFCIIISDFSGLHMRSRISGWFVYELKRSNRHMRDNAWRGGLNRPTRSGGWLLLIMHTLRRIIPLISWSFIKEINIALNTSTLFMLGFFLGLNCFSLKADSLCSATQCHANGYGAAPTSLHSSEEQWDAKHYI